jgi:hypothetical protein
MDSQLTENNGLRQRFPFPNDLVMHVLYGKRPIWFQLRTNRIAHTQGRNPHMTSQAAVSARSLLFSLKRAFFSSINASATNRGPAFVTVAGVCALLLLGGLAPAHAQSPNVKFFASQSVFPPAV